MIAVLFLVSQYSDYLNYRSIVASQAENGILYDPLIPAFTAFNNWLGGNAVKLAPTVYFFIFPLLIAIPFGWSLAAERRSGYIHVMVIRTGRMRYYVSKYLAVFISAGLAMVMPLIFSFFIALLVFPAATPDIMYDQFHSVFTGALMSRLYYSQPFLYVGLYILVIFAFCGLLGGIAFSVASLTKSSIKCMLAPFFVCIIFHYAVRMIYPPQAIFPELSPLNFLHPAQFSQNANWAVIAGEALLLAWLTIGVTIATCKNHEIYD